MRVARIGNPDAVASGFEIGEEKREQAPALQNGQAQRYPG
jgi:hypothetical protein